MITLEIWQVVAFFMALHAPQVFLLVAIYRRQQGPVIALKNPNEPGHIFLPGKKKAYTKTPGKNRVIARSEQDEAELEENRT